MTLEKAKEVLAAENIHMNRATISRIAKDQKLSYQKTTSRAAFVFTRDGIEKRHDYVVKVDEIPNNLVWYLDESGFNLHIVPDRSWAKKGKTPVQRVNANRQRNLSLLMCIGHDGVKSYELRDGAFTSKTFLAYIKRLAHRFPEVRHGRVTLVMDNARINHARATSAFLLEKNIRHIFLPAYSPELNPIENVFGVLKARYRRRGVVHSEGHMKRRIKNIIDQMKDGLDVQTFHDHMRRFVQMAMNRQPFN